MLSLFRRHTRSIIVVWFIATAVVAMYFAPRIDSNWVALALLLVALAPVGLALGLAIKDNWDEFLHFLMTIIGLGALIAVGAVVLGSAGDYWEKNEDRWFPRWSEGDCYVTIFGNGAPSTGVTRVITRAPNGAYLLQDDDGGPNAQQRTMSEAQYRADETRFHLQFKKVKCR